MIYQCFAVCFDSDFCYDKARRSLLIVDLGLHVLLGTETIRHDTIRYDEQTASLGAASSRTKWG